MTSTDFDREASPEESWTAIIPHEVLLEARKQASFRTNILRVLEGDPMLIGPLAQSPAAPWRNPDPIAEGLRWRFRSERSTGDGSDFAANNQRDLIWDKKRRSADLSAKNCS